jgi:crotonobetainyl-CoA:carnitine CoA-transferase CaiB-like acyl-CoA transferase
MENERRHISRGCARLSLAVIAALALLGLVMVGLVARFATSERGERAARVTRAVAELGASGERAPSAAALREAGCARALVLSMEEVAERAEARLPRMSGMDLVICSVDLGATPPPCDVLARAHASTAGGRMFQIEVQRGLIPTLSCPWVYDASGAPLRPGRRRGG